MLSNREIIFNIGANIEGFKRQLDDAKKYTQQLKDDFNKGIATGISSKELKAMKKDIQDMHNYQKKVFNEKTRQEKEILKIRKESGEITQKQYQEELNNIKNNASAQKKADLEHEEKLKNFSRLIKDVENAEKQKADADKRDLELQKQKKKEYEDQRNVLREQLNLLNQIKSVGSTISGVGTAMVGTAAAGYGVVNAGAKSYLDNFLEMNRMLAIKTREMEGTTSKQWESTVLQNAYKYGVAPKELAKYTSNSLNASSVYGTAQNMSASANLMAVTGISGESVATASSMYQNKLKNNGWTNYEQYMDAMLTMFNYSSGTPEEMVKYYNNISNYTSGFDKYDKMSAMKVLALGSRMTPSDISLVATSIRQSSADAIKKDIPSAVKTIAGAKGLSVQDYIKQSTGVSVDSFDSMQDIYKMGQMEYFMLLSTLANDAKNIDGSFRREKSDGTYETVTAKQLSAELYKNISGNVRGQSILDVFYQAKQNGEYDKIQKAFTDENIKGSLKESSDAYYNSDAGKLETSMQRISTSILTLVSRLSPFFAGFFEKLVEWTDFLQRLNFEDLAEHGRNFAEILGMLVGFGVPLIAVGKIITFIAGTMSTFVNLKLGLMLLTDASVGTSKIFGLTAKSFVNSGNVIGQSAVNTANTMGSSVGAVVGKFGLLVGTVGLVITAFNMLIGIINDVAELVNTEAMKKARTDWKNGVDSEHAKEYEKQLNDPWFRFWESIGLSADGNKDNDHVKLDGTLGNGESMLVSALDGVLNYADNYLNNLGPLGDILKGFGVEELSVTKGFGDLLTVLGKTATPGGWQPMVDAGQAWKDVSGMINDHSLTKSYTEGEKKATQEKYKGEYKGDEDPNDLLSQLTPDEITYTPMEYEPLDVEDVYNAMEDGTAAGAEKGVKNAMEGFFNVPDTYSILGQTGLGQLNRFEDFAVSRQGNKAIINNNNINMTINGNNKQEIIDAITEILGITGALGGATSFDI